LSKGYDRTGKANPEETPGRKPPGDQTRPLLNNEPKEKGNGLKEAADIPAEEAETDPKAGIEPNQRTKIKEREIENDEETNECTAGTGPGDEPECGSYGGGFGDNG
jgi:hypothetical protein